MADTKKFKNFAEFLSREDKATNGVSEDFAAANPNYEKDNESNSGCWNCSYCSDCSVCRVCRDCSYCSYCSYCSDCSDCSDCSYCSYCSYCSDCSDCSGQEREGMPEIPAIENIHQAIETVCSNEEAFDMSEWHATKTSETGAVCGTTHCRAGWVVTCAGEKGLALEKATSTCFAAMQIYKKSSPSIPVPVTRFFDDNETAMKDILRCAENERAEIAAQ